jgi:shikimate dehydrogenase
MNAQPGIDGGTRIYGIIGHPVRHSLSPVMQNAAFEALGLNARYVPFPVEPRRVGEALAGLAAAGVQGLNVTVPHKQAVMPFLKGLSGAARAIGAVNCLRLADDGGYEGTNTDGVGFMLSLQHDLDFSPVGKVVLMLGAGGAARAIGWHLLEAGVARLTIANRTFERAQELARALRADPGGEVDAIPFDAVEGKGPHLLINATSVGMGDGHAPVRLRTVEVREAVMDIVYSPPSTPLLEQARELGLARANGMGMLLYQGVAAFKYFTGEEAPVPAMREALVKALEQRLKQAGS